MSEIADTILIRRDTAANWTSANPILANGEFGIETDTRLLKFGDGVTSWNNLPYVSDESGLENPAMGTVMRALDGLQLKAKLNKINGIETKVNDIVLKNGNVTSSGNINDNPSSSNRYALISLSNDVVEVRCLGMTLTTDHRVIGWSFGHYENIEGINTWISDKHKLFDKSESDGYKEYVLSKPEDSTHFAITVKSYVNNSNRFYCYLYSGGFAIGTEHVDKEPTKGSDNVPSSNGVAELIRHEQSESFFALQDLYGHAIAKINEKGLLLFIRTVLDSLHVNNINNIFSFSEIGVKDDTSLMITDKMGHILFSIKNGTWKDYTNSVFDDESFDTIKEIANEFANEIDVLRSLKSVEEDSHLQLLVSTDTHTNTAALSRAFLMKMAAPTIDALLLLGDYSTRANSANDSEINASLDIINSHPLVKKFMAVGNHELGEYSKAIQLTKDDEYIRENFIENNLGSYDEGDLVEGKLYYHHNFDNFKTKLIVLYPFEDGCIIDETIWKKVTYNSGKKMITPGEYRIDTVVNVPGYTKHSFQAVQDVIVEPIVKTGSAGNATHPSYKAYRHMMWYTQAQLNWFVAQLKNAHENGYNVIVAQHYPFFVNQMVDKTKKFTNTCRDGDYYPFWQRLGNNRDIISRITHAFISHSSFHATMSPVQTTTDPYDFDIIDDVSSIDSYELIVDFSDLEGVTKVPLFLSGHSHSDAVVKNSDYGFTNLIFLSGVVENKKSKDIIRPTQGHGMDALTAVTLFDDGVQLTRIGNTASRRKSDTEKIVVKDNEFINTQNI